MFVPKKQNNCERYLLVFVYNTFFPYDIGFKKLLLVVVIVIGMGFFHFPFLCGRIHMLLVLASCHVMKVCLLLHLLLGMVIHLLMFPCLSLCTIDVLIFHILH